MKPEKTARQVRALGLCSGGLDSILSAMILKHQGIEVTWICFVTPFFSAGSAEKAAARTHIPLIIKDITDSYMQMMRDPKAGFGKNMNPCMDCHALMFEEAGRVMKKEGFDFLFSGEVMGQRPKSQNKNALRYVEKNSGYDGKLLRPLSARLLPETEMEKQGLVDREKLLAINGRSRKTQMTLAKQFGITDYPSPAGGCLLTDAGFSKRLKDLMAHGEPIEKRQLHYLKSGRHFRIDAHTKVIVGRSKYDNKNLMAHLDRQKDTLVKHATLPGPDVILTGNCTAENIARAAQICAAYTKSPAGTDARVRILQGPDEHVVTVVTPETEDLKELMI